MSMHMATKVMTLRNGAGTVFYVACDPDSHGNYRQYTADEVEKASTGKFEVCESSTAASIVKEVLHEHSTGWVKDQNWRQKPHTRSSDRSTATIADRLKTAFGKILPPEEAVLAARGPMQNGTDIDVQLRGRALTDRLGHDLMDVER